MQKIRIASLVMGSLLLAAGHSQAQQNEASASVAFSTDYIFRGISQTEGRPAVHGELSYLDDSGFYGALWGSNIAYGRGLELEATAGLTRSLSELLAYDVGLVYYNYPGASDLDTIEVFAALEYAGLRGAVAHTTDYFGTGASSNHYSLDYSVALIDNLYLGLGLGLTEASRGIFGTRDRYGNYGASLTAYAAGLGVSLSWTNTNLSRRHCEFSTDCSANLALTISRAF